jgi:hypothetical protein
VDEENFQEAVTEAIHQKTRALLGHGRTIAPRRQANETGVACGDWYG